VQRAKFAGGSVGAGPSEREAGNLGHQVAPQHCPRSPHKLLHLPQRHPPRQHYPPPLSPPRCAPSQANRLQRGEGVWLEEWKEFVTYDKDGKRTLQGTRTLRYYP